MREVVFPSTRTRRSRHYWTCGLAVRSMVLALLACAPSKPAVPAGPRAQRAFYYWRTVVRFSPTESEALLRLKVDRLYLRMFDVEWNRTTAAAEQVGKVTLAAGQVLPSGVEIVPVVFLREEVFRNLPEDQLADLADALWREVQARAARLGFVPRELQLDCDWTDRTQAAFFAMLRELRRSTAPRALESRALRLSATIRLHQVKYRERTGVPPVDRGMLMFYNMGSFTADSNTRSIFDADSAARYLSRVREYPLPLDVALPIWSWTLHLRDDRVIDVLQSTDPDELSTAGFLRSAGTDRYLVTASTFFHGELLRQGDQLKTETTGPGEVAAAAALIAPRLAPAPGGSPRWVALFDLSARNLTRHPLNTLERLFESVR
jgi:hypothetical protein